MLLLNNCYKTVTGHLFAICIFIFNKTKVQTFILRYLLGLNLNWVKSYGLKCSQTKIFPFLFFCDFVQKHKFAFFAFFGFCVVTFVPIKICYAPQNDHLNLSFEKDNHVVSKKKARCGRKMAVYQMLLFKSSPNLHAASCYI